MRRTVLILLVLANAVVLFWNLSGDQPPARTASLVPGNPAMPREIVLGPMPASRPEPVPAATQAASPVVKAASPAPATEPVASGPSDPLCVQTAWMPAQRIEVLSHDPALRADRIAGQWLRLRAKGRPLWMVFAGPMAQKDIQPLQTALAAKGVATQEVFTPWRFALPVSAQRGLNLGYYDTEAAAQVRRDQAVAAGATQAAVVAMALPSAQRLRARLKDETRVQALIAASDPRAPWQACAPGVTAESAPTLNDAAFGDGEGVTTEGVSKRR